jgi:hypothetical protein
MAIEDKDTATDLSVAPVVGTDPWRRCACRSMSATGNAKA